MALDVDGFAILGTITRSPDVFPDIRMEAAKAARMLVAKQLKAKGLTVHGLRAIHQTLGAEPFALIADGLTDAEARSLVARLDGSHPDLKSSPPDWPRRHLAALADGLAPTSTSGSAAASARGQAPKVEEAPRALGSAAFAASWDGKDHDPKPKKSKKKK